MFNVEQLSRRSFYHEAHLNVFSKKFFTNQKCKKYFKTYSKKKSCFFGILIPFADQYYTL